MTLVQKITIPLQPAPQAQLPFTLEETVDYIPNEESPQNLNLELTGEYIPEEKIVQSTIHASQIKIEDEDPDFTLSFESNLKALKNYKIIKPIDKGGMGSVHLGLNELTNENVAIKIIKDEFLYDEKHISRLKREATILQNIQHPNIVKVIDFGLIENKPALVMEYIEGETLDNLMGKLNFENYEDLNLFKKIIVQISYAAHGVHVNGIIHRDIKPSNVIIGKEKNIKLIDFGLAKISRVDIETSRRTSITTILGTPEYMAPEQVECSTDINDPRTDSYAIGVILYKAFTGRGPIDLSNCTKEEVFKRILTEKSEHPIKLNPKLNPVIAGMMYCLVQKKPEWRYPYSLEKLGRFLELFDTKNIFTTLLQKLSSAVHL